MNSKIHPLAVVLILLLTGFSIALWVWGTGEAKKIGGPSALETDHNGHLYIQIQNQLLEHDAQGIFLRRHDLSKLAIDQLLGDIGFFSNGDILLRRGPDPRTLPQNLRAYQRRTNEQSLTPLTPNTGLFRCNLDTSNCDRFGSEGIDFKAAHSIFIDRRTDDVYIADTTRHLLRKYSGNGEVLSEPAAGFNFPNQVLMHDDQLYVASTNNHQIRKIDPSTRYFGKEIESIDVRPPAAVAAGQTWPTDIARVADTWWVNNMRNTMSEGGIYIFNDEWGFEKQVDLPANADPISLLPFQGEVLVSDWKNDRIYRISEKGEMLENFVSPGLEEILEGSRALRLQFRIYACAGIVLFVFVLIGLIIRARMAGKSADLQRGAASKTTLATPGVDEIVRFEPDPKTVQKHKISIRLVMILMITGYLVLGTIVLLTDKGQSSLLLLIALGGLAAISVLVAWINRVNTNTAISFRGKSITLHDHTGRESTWPVRDVIYDYTTVASPDMAVFLGQPQMPIYNRQILADKLFPRLADAERVSIWTMQTRLFRIRHPQGLTAALVLFCVAACAAWLLAQSVIRAN